MKTNPSKISIAEHYRHLYGLMPPLPHRNNRADFGWKDSAVCQWLASVSPKVGFTTLFTRAQDAGAILFDPGTGLWRGCHYAEPGKAQEGGGIDEGCVGAASGTAPDAMVAQRAEKPAPSKQPEWKLRWRDAKMIARWPEGRAFLAVSGAVDDGLLKMLIPEAAKKE